MRKFVSLFLALIMICSLSLCVFAAQVGDIENPNIKSTEVTYTGKGEEKYTVTVPADLTPGGDAKSVTASGTWASNRKLIVTAPTTVTLKNSINASESKILAVNFANIDLVGSNTVSVSTTENISVAEITDALFGTWTGIITYTIDLVDVE